MLKSLVALGLLTLALAGSPQSVNATPIAVMDNEELVGIKGVSVDGVDYDVAFEEGSYNSLSGGWGYIFTSATAAAAGQGLIQAFQDIATLTAGVVNVADTAKVLWGIDVDSGTVYVPTDDQRSTSHVSATVHIVPLSDPLFSVGGALKLDTFDTTSDSTTVYSSWNLAAPTTAVPEPNTAILLGSGILGLVAYRKRRQTS